MKKATLRLFKALPISSKRKKVYQSLIQKTIQHGFIFSPEVMYNYTEEELNKLVNVINKEIGLSPEQMNSSFHKSWKKIKEAPLQQLIMEQLVHYITTYGFESMGIYNESSVYIPAEKLTIPKVEYNTSFKKTGIDKFIFTVIKGYTAKEIQAKLEDMLSSGIALSEDTMKDVVTLIQEPEYSVSLDVIKNKEVKIRMYDELGMIPKEPVEFLRYVIFKSTGKSLLIKNKDIIESIKVNGDVASYFKKYKKQNDLADLAKIFYRFKPLFLAFRNKGHGLNPIINKIRRLAEKYHQPMPEDYLNEVTAKIGRGEKIKKSELTESLKKANTFRKIRLAYALKYRTGDFDSIQYTVRNDKSFSTDFSFLPKEKAKEALEIVVDSIVEDIKKNVNGKNIYIPSNVEYALPSTEKRFTGCIPSGTCITLPQDMVAGIHWENLDHERVDLDLSLLSVGGKFGWDASYRHGNGSILFSGDQTDAPKPKGASELFYIKKTAKSSYLLQVNHFNFYGDGSGVPLKIMIGRCPSTSFNKDCLVDPNKVVAVVPTKMDKRQKTLGLISVTSKECSFYFSESYLGNSITSSSNAYINQARDFLMNSLTNMITLNSLLIKAGATIVDDKEDCDIDLSPESLEKDTIINILK
jgi:hypothetical protein